MPEVSIILPVYNTAAYLEEAVGSVTRQEGGIDLEIILVDDGSTDGRSPALCDRLARNDSRIRVIHQTNQGLSMARNAGLAAATGDYLLFLDSDDFWIRTDTLSRLLAAYRHHPECDFIGFNWIEYYSPERQRRSVDFGRYVPEVTDGSTALRSLLRSGMTPMTACAKILRRSFLTDHNIRFIPGITSEDIPWFMELLTTSDHCLFLHDYLYGYRQQVSGSITARYTHRRFDHLTQIVREGVAKALTEPRAEMKEALLAFYATEYCILLSHIDVVPKGERAKVWALLKRYRYLLHYDLSPKVRLARRVGSLVGLPNLSHLLRLRNRLRR